MRDIRVTFPRPCDERWDGMTPVDCGRLCARCDKIVQDLEDYTVEEADALLRRHPETCVRAVVDRGGVVALKPGTSARRMVIAAAVTAGLLTAGEPAFAKEERPRGAISGKLDYHLPHVRIVATDQAGAVFRGKVGARGRFRIRHLPAGTYSLTFIPDCGERWTVADVVVGDGETIVPPAKSDSMCIVIGMLRIEDDKG
jgi:hypothetical protein